MLLKELTELHGVSGNEDEVRNFIQEKIKGYATDIKIDSIGNILAFKKGRKSRHRVMLCAHMDEVGFMATGYGDNGTIKFRPVGGIDDRILLSKRVVIGDKKIKGVIGYRPVHLQEKDERKNVVKYKQLYIDIGAGSKDEAKKLVSEGDFISFDSEYASFGSGLAKAKSLDDRLGCAVLIEILKRKYDHDLYTCFTVQEEVGLRGAKVAAYSIKPDVAVILEGTTCSDVPGVEKQDYSTRLGEGAALTIMDRTSYSNKYLVEYLHSLAVRNSIKVQYKQTITGGNDAGAIHTSVGGIPAAIISVPCRYIHSPVSVASIRDYESCRDLTGAFMEELDWKRIFG